MTDQELTDLETETVRRCSLCHTLVARHGDHDTRCHRFFRDQLLRLRDGSQARLVLEYFGACDDHKLMTLLDAASHAAFEQIERLGPKPFPDALKEAWLLHERIDALSKRLREIAARARAWTGPAERLMARDHLRDLAGLLEEEADKLAPDLGTPSTT